MDQNNCSIFVEMNDFLQGNISIAAVTLHTILCTSPYESKSNHLTNSGKAPHTAAYTLRQLRAIQDLGSESSNNTETNTTLIDMLDAPTQLMLDNRTLAAAFQSFAFPNRIQLNTARQLLYLKPHPYAAVGARSAAPLAALLLTVRVQRSGCGAAATRRETRPPRGPARSSSRSRRPPSRSQTPASALPSRGRRRTRPSRAPRPPRQIALCSTARRRRGRRRMCAWTDCASTSLRGARRAARASRSRGC